MKLKHKTMNKRNYTKFYALLRQCPSADKDELVLQYTDGRTTHLTSVDATVPGKPTGTVKTQFVA